MLSTADGVYRSVPELAVGDSGWSIPGEFSLIQSAKKSRAGSVQGRRFLNVTVAVVALIVLFPLMLLVALGIKLTSRGPVLFRQPRVGIDRRQGSGGNWRRTVDYGGKLFTIYKFRTMRMQREHANAEVWAKPGDPRVTPLGRVLRKYRLDELPQLINVLKGEMNIVGPRPEQPAIFMSLRDQVHQYTERQRVLPGITGWAQINQPYDRDLDDVRRKVELDLEYAARVSVLEDARIMLRTLPVVVLGKGAW